MNWQTLVMAAIVGVSAPAFAATPDAKSAEPESFTNKKPHREVKLPAGTKAHLKKYEAFKKAQKKPPKIVDETRMPRFVISSKRALAFEADAKPIYVQGKVEEYSDGALRLSLPMSPRALQAWTQKTGRPVSQAPHHQWFRVYDFQKVPKVRIERAIGQVVRLEIRKDKGNTPFVFDILPAK